MALDSQAKAGACQGSRLWGDGGAKSRQTAWPCEAGSLDLGGLGSRVEKAMRGEGLAGAATGQVVAEVACKRALDAYNMAVPGALAESHQGMLVNSAAVDSMVNAGSRDLPVHTTGGRAMTTLKSANCMKDLRLVIAGKKRAHFQYLFANLGPFAAQFDSLNPELAAWLGFTLDLSVLNFDE